MKSINILKEITQILESKNIKYAVETKKHIIITIYPEDNMCSPIKISLSKGTKRDYHKNLIPRLLSSID